MSRVLFKSEIPAIRLVVCCAVMMLCALPAAFSQELVLLTPQQIQELTEPAATAYQKALDLRDKVLWPEFTRELEQAADLDPVHIPLQFLTARQGVHMARIGKGTSIHSGIELIKTDEDLGHEYYDISEKCLQRILDTKNLPQDLFQYAQNMMQTVKRERNDLPRRMARQQEIAYQFMLEHVQEIYPVDRSGAAAPVGTLMAPTTEQELNAPPRSQAQQLQPAQLAVNPFQGTLQGRRPGGSRPPRPPGR